jgi:hypothetical protein
MIANGRWQRENGWIWRPAFTLAVCHATCAIALLAGCASEKKPTTRPAGAYDRQEAALRDPFGYSPNIEKSSGCSGGDWGKYDREGMRKDIDHVLNP